MSSDYYDHLVVGDTGISPVCIEQALGLLEMQFVVEAVDNEET